jgi:hypothetical protein
MLGGKQQDIARHRPMEFSQVILVALVVGGAIIVFLIPVEFLLAYDRWIRQTVGSSGIVAYMVAFFAGGFVLAKNIAIPVSDGQFFNTGMLALFLLMAMGAFSVIWFWLRVYKKD